MFIQINGIGNVNINNIVMITKHPNMKDKFQVVLSHGGKIMVTKTVRDDILNHGNMKLVEAGIVPPNTIIGVDYSSGDDLTVERIGRIVDGKFVELGKYEYIAKNTDAEIAQIKAFENSDMNDGRTFEEKIEDGKKKKTTNKKKKKDEVKSDE